jgi:glucose-1-phosphate adenylyltransferase
MNRRTLVMVLAGGKGSRLGPLTTHRAKPAVPFAGRYRIIDFVLSNLVNSGYRQVYVLTQYMASSLIKHLSRNWHLSGMGEFIEVVPAQMRAGEFWYRGTADSVYQNLNLIGDSRAEHVAIFGGDHIYKFAADQMEAFHRENDADLTIAAFPVPRKEAHQFGCMHVDASGRITAFVEKPKDPPPMPGNPEMSLVSMGNYFFRANVLKDALLADAADDTAHDFGKNIIPTLLKAGARLFAYDFDQNRIPGEPPEARPYWRDVGTIDSYLQANMEVRSPLPAVNLYNRQWRVRTAQRDYPPARFVRHAGRPTPVLEDSLVCEGTIVQSAQVIESLLGYDCFVRAGAQVKGTLLLSGCDVGEDAILSGVLLDKNCRVEPGARLGLDPEADARRFPFRSESGVIALPKGTRVPAEGPIEFAYDVVELMLRDPATKDAMEALDGYYTVSDVGRHSYSSAGPRYDGRRGVVLP